MKTPRMFGILDELWRRNHSKPRWEVLTPSRGTSTDYHSPLPITAENYRFLRQALERVPTVFDFVQAPEERHQVRFDKLERKVHNVRGETRATTQA